MNAKNYDKLDMLAEMLEPIGEIAGDREAMALWRRGARVEAIKRMIVAHKDAVIRILAAIEGEDPETYTLDGGILLLKILAKFRELREVAEALFPTQAPRGAAASSGAATGDTTAGAR